MVEEGSWLTARAHGVLIPGVVVVAFPLYVTLIASTHDLPTLLRGRVPLLPGDQGWTNYAMVLGRGIASGGAPPAATMLKNSLVMALGIAVGKIAISLIAAYAIVYL